MFEIDDYDESNDDTLDKGFLNYGSLSKILGSRDFNVKYLKTRIYKIYMCIWDWITLTHTRKQGFECERTLTRGWTLNICESWNTACFVSHVSWFVFVSPSEQQDNVSATLIVVWTIVVLTLSRVVNCLCSTATRA